MKSGVFITGTDTGVGKTVVSSLIYNALKAYQLPAGYFKPIQTGSDWDTVAVADASGAPVTDFPQPVYLFAPPMAPYRAAQIEGQEIDLQKVVQAWQRLDDRFWVLEGAGGLLVPLTETQTTRDLVRLLGLKVVLVSSTQLGTINHTLLTLEAAQAAQVEVLGLVWVGEKDPGLEDVIKKFAQIPVLAHIPQLDDLSPCTFQAMSREFFPRSILEKMFLPHEGLEYHVPAFVKRDQEVIWHPYSQHGLNREILPVVSAQGAYLKLADQREILDGISSWWVNLHGHSHPGIAKAIHDQSLKLEHVIFSGFTHEPAVRLAEVLTEHPAAQRAKLSRVFYSDNGSTAVEAALKMAYQYFLNRGMTKRTRFLALRNAYHGDTLGAMAVGEPEGFHSAFRKLMPAVDFVDPGNTVQLRELLDRKPDIYAAFIFEPLVQGAAGMKMYSSEYLREAVALCQEREIVTICDEVFTGFYRTGKCFAFEHADIQPDMICLSKGITGGFLPLAVTLVQEKIFTAFVSKDIRMAFLHGHSYTANPISCAAALESWSVLHTVESQTRIQAIVQQTRKWIEHLRKHPQAAAARCLGTIGAVEVKGGLNYYSSEVSAFFQFSLERGVLLRPLGSVIYAVPPYCCKIEEIDQIYGVMEALLDSVSS